MRNQIALSCLCRGNEDLLLIGHCRSNLESNLVRLALCDFNEAHLLMGFVLEQRNASPPVCLGVPQENNVCPWDLSSTEPYQRDNILHFI